MDELLKEINRQCRGTMIEHLGMEFTAMGEDWLEVRMPIDHRTARPGGYLNGGAIMALAETAGSGLSFINTSQDQFDIFGIEINGNHIYRAEGSYVTGRAEYIHRGSKTQVVSVKISDEYGNLASICRITNIIIKKL